MRKIRADHSAAARACRGLALAGLVCLGVLQAGQGAALPPDQISQELEVRLGRLAAAEADPAARGRSAAVLISDADLAALAASAATKDGYGPPLGPVLTPDANRRAALSVPTRIPVAGQKPEGGRLDLRLALTMLSLTQDDEDNGAVMDAQTDPARNALVLKSGEANLATIGALLRQTGLAGKVEGRSVTLQVPLVIWPGATLRLNQGDQLLLSRQDGAFVMNFGIMAVEGATIRTVGELNTRIKRFRPFVTTADRGTILLRRAEIVGLGFGNTMKYSGVSVQRSLLRPSDYPTIIEASLFEDVQSVVVQGDEGSRIADNRFRAARGPALVISGARDVVITGNLFSGGMPTNAIRLEQGSAKGLIAANVILGGERAGIVVRQESPAAVVSGNVVWDRKGGGILVQDSPCAAVQGNLVIGNSQKGIEMRDAPDGVLTANSVLSNDSAALWISDQQSGTQTTIGGNVLAFNGAGLAAAQGGKLVLQGNDLTRQYLQFVSGDLVPMAAQLARDMRGAEEIVLETGVSPTDRRRVDRSAEECKK